MSKFDRPAITPPRKCPNCKEELKPGETGHFVPPSLGQKGFFLCETPEMQRLIDVVT